MRMLSLCNPMSDCWKTIILGGGPAGLATAIGHGPDALVLEQQAHVGGLAASVEIDGVTFDLGGHSFHTPHPDVKKLVYDSVEMFEQRRIARCFAYNSMIQYPFQKHFQDLQDSTVVDECLSGLKTIQKITEATTLDSYLLKKFGAGIAEHFMLPYNEKLWGKRLQRIVTGWVQERIPQRSDQAASRPEGKRQPLYDDTIVAYPVKGGFGEIASALSRQVGHLRTNTSVTVISSGRRELRTADGQVFHWQQLVSTLPVPSLLQLLDDCPQHLRNMAAELEYVSLGFALVRLNGRLDTEIQRVYCADETSPAHKIVLCNTASQYLRQKPNHGIMGEISLTDGRRLDRRVMQRFINGLIEMGLLDSEERVAGASFVETKYGYPVQTATAGDTIKRIKEWLEERGIHTVGRFGEWSYINSDEAIFRGLSLGRNLASGDQATHVFESSSKAVVT